MNQSLDWAYDVLKKKDKPVLSVEIFRRVPWSIVYRLMTEDEIYYLKVSHPLYSIEGKTLLFFKKHHFKHVPNILSYNEKLNAIVLENAGHNFHEIFKGVYHHSLLKKAIGYYAVLQIHSSNYLKQLSKIIPKSCDLNEFPSELEKFLIDEQDILLKDGVCTQDLMRCIRLLPKIENICHMLSSCHIPNAIEHGDLFDENFLLNKRSLIINDWADAGLGQPFFSYGFFIHRLQQSYHLSSLMQTDLKKTYLNHWKNFYSYDDLNDLLKTMIPLSSLRTMMSYARIARINKNRKMSRYQGYLRQNLLSFLHEFKLS